MIIPTVFLCVVGVALVWRRVRVVRRRREERVMVVTTCPEIELGQRYGGWDAGAYDAFSGRDHSWQLSISRGAYAWASPRRRR